MSGTVDPRTPVLVGVGTVSADAEAVELMAGATEAAIIGEARKPKEHKGIVLFKSGIGGYRILEAPVGNLVPRIC